ncbi:hypothetical protein PFISCL1PPCAC_18041, partial [Pristionchus fissidentatus]
SRLTLSSSLSTHIHLRGPVNSSLIAPSSLCIARAQASNLGLPESPPRFIVTVSIVQLTSMAPTSGNDPVASRTRSIVRRLAKKLKKNSDP